MSSVLTTSFWPKFRPRIITVQRLAMVAMWSGPGLLAAHTLVVIMRISRRISSTFGPVNMVTTLLQFIKRLRSPNTRLRTQLTLPLSSTSQVAGPVHLTTHVLLLSRTLRVAISGTRSTK